MTVDLESKVPLVQDHDHDDYNTGIHEHTRVMQQLERRRRYVLWAAVMLLILSAVANVFQLLSKPQDHSGKQCTERSPYTGLAFDTDTTFEYETGFWGKNDTEADELWDAIDTGPMVIAPTNEWVDSVGLQRSGDFEAARFPWEPERGLFFLKVFHQLHCLKLTRRAYLDALNGVESDVAMEHVLHCLDSMRQDVTCKADDTPMPIMTNFEIGDKQIRQCKDFDRLVEWSRAPERHSCVETLSDYKPIYHPIEWYQFCREDSPHYPVMQAYFEKHGHKDTFVP